MELHTSGSSCWGEYGYSPDRVAFAEYKLQGGYASMTGTAAVSDLRSEDGNGDMYVLLADGELTESETAADPDGTAEDGI